jgi:hypothetical protein
VLSAIESFLARCKRPAILEHGDTPIALIEGAYSLEIRSEAIHLSAWPDDRSFNRRLVSIEATIPGAMECIVQRFGGATAKLNLLDLDHPRAAARLLRGDRRTFSEAFRRMLARQFPGWEIRSLSTEALLQHSFSPVYPRALLQRGTQQIAAMACPTSADEHGFLSFALLWHHYLCGRAGNHRQIPLALFLPDGAGSTTALRLKWLELTCRIFRFNVHGSAGEVDVRDLGNLDTHLARRAGPAELDPNLLAFVRRLENKYGAECVDEPDGSLSLRCSGLAFARISEAKLYCGLGEKSDSLSTLEQGEQLAAHLAPLRGPASRNRSHPLYRSHPERWLESAVRRNPGIVDAMIEGQPLLGQVITFAGGDRDIIDLIGVSADGRTAILELKASEDIHLPLQALDYWMRADWHVRSGDLDSFFPGIPIRRESPRLLLVAPGVRFHPSNEVVLSYFSPQIETERVGVNLEWQQGLKVVFRLRGAEQPQSHGVQDERHIQYPPSNPKS